jgi:hypothetical protein
VAWEEVMMVHERARPKLVRPELVGPKRALAADDMAPGDPSAVVSLGEGGGRREREGRQEA